MGAAGGTAAAAAAGSGTGEPRSRTACLGLRSTRSGAGEAMPPPGWCLHGDPEPNGPDSGAEGRRTPRLPAPGGSGSRPVTCGGGGGGGSRGGEGASFRKGWDLPARPPPPAAARPVPDLLRGPRCGASGGRRSPAVRASTSPSPRLPSSHPRPRPGVDGPTASFQSQSRRVCLALLTQQKAGRNPGSSASWLFIPDLL